MASTDATSPSKQKVGYGVVPRPLPAANAPDLLAEAKLHPKTIVHDNPKDPVFWSTCYDRVKIREWLPLIGDEMNEDKVSGVPYSFNNGTHCLACDCVRKNYLVEYDMDKMESVNWWLQPQGSCNNCDYEVFNITTPAPPTTRKPTTTPPTTKQNTKAKTTADSKAKITA